VHVAYLIVHLDEIFEVYVVLLRVLLLEPQVPLLDGCINLKQYKVVARA